MLAIEDPVCFECLGERAFASFSLTNSPPTLPFIHVPFLLVLGYNTIWPGSGLERKATGAYTRILEWSIFSFGRETADTDLRANLPAHGGDGPCNTIYSPFEE